MKPLPETDFLLQLTDFGIKLGLDKTRHLLKQFGEPHLQYPSILIAGTNGKGSVAKTVANILTCAGYRTGLYTSPHLVHVGERIVFNGQPIGADSLARKIRRLQKILGSQPNNLCPTFFEALTTIAFSYFADMKADIVVCEVGMGGRFDSTNVLPAFLQVITKIGKEHTQYLGKTYEEIASEKAGIIKRGSVVISAYQKDRAMNVIRSKAEERNATLYTYRKDFTVRRTAVSVCGQEFNFYSGKQRFPALNTPLLGRYQMENMALAVQTVGLLGQKGFPVEKEALYKGVSTTVWPCRFQVMKEAPVVVVDGAHNPDGMRTLSGTLAEVFPGKKFSFLTGILKDKDWRKMLRILLGTNDISEIVFTRPETERALDPAVLAGFVKDRKIKSSRRASYVPFPAGEQTGTRGKNRCGDIKITVIPKPSTALKYVKNAKKDWCVCGSLYLCGDALSCLQGSGKSET